MSQHTQYFYEVLATDAVCDAAAFECRQRYDLYAGDANADGQVDFAALLVVAQNYGTSITKTAALTAITLGKSPRAGTR